MYYFYIIYKNARIYYIPYRFFEVIAISSLKAKPNFVKSFRCVKHELLTESKIISSKIKPRFYRLFGSRSARVRTEFASWIWIPTQTVVDVNKKIKKVLVFFPRYCQGQSPHPVVWQWEHFLYLNT